MEIIVTDLTRFKDDAVRCVAGIDPVSGKCIRPLPYLRSIECKDHQILPGDILSGDFMPDYKAKMPHIEDHVYQRISKKGSVSALLVHCCNKKQENLRQKRGWSPGIGTVPRGR